MGDKNKQTELNIRPIPTYLHCLVIKVMRPDALALTRFDDWYHLVLTSIATC